MATRHRCCRSQFTADVAVQYFQLISGTNVLHKKLREEKKHRAAERANGLEVP